MRLHDHFRADARLSLALQQSDKSAPIQRVLTVLDDDFEQLHPDHQAAVAECLSLVAEHSRQQLNRGRKPTNRLYW